MSSLITINFKGNTNALIFFSIIIYDKKVVSGSFMVAGNLNKNKKFTVFFKSFGKKTKNI